MPEYNDKDIRTMAAAIAAKLNHASEWDWKLVALQGIEPWFDG